MPQLPKCPPSDTYTHLDRSLVVPNNSCRYQNAPDTGLDFLHNSTSFLRAVFGSHRPNLKFRSVRTKARGPRLANPICELTAAPDVAIAVPTMRPPDTFRNAPGSGT